jgi:hypothetical protein
VVRRLHEAAGLAAAAEMRRQTAAGLTAISMTRAVKAAAATLTIVAALRLEYQARLA